MTISLADVIKSGNFVTGRPATQDDVQSSKAVFSGKPSGTPFNIEVPQYAWHVDQNDKTKTLHFIIQGEENAGLKVIGAINVEDGSLLAALDWEFELLGQCPPTT